MKRLIIIIFLFFVSILNAKEKTNDLVWDGGIAFRNGKAIYFDPDKLDTIEFFVSDIYITNQTKYHSIFPGGYLFWNAEEEGNLAYYSVSVTKPGYPINEMRKVINYQVSNEAIYLTDDKTNWEKMDFRLIRTNPSPHVDFLIYLKSRWFEGEYYILRP